MTAPTKKIRRKAAGTGRSPGAETPRGLPAVSSSVDSIEAASQLLVIKQQQQADATLVEQTLVLLHRIVCMLTKMASGTKERRSD
jgi:hypothetical protein